MHLPTTIVIVGGNRTGKSCFGARLCGDMDRRFYNSQARTFFTIPQFLDIVDDIKADYEKNILNKHGLEYRNYSYWILGDEVSQSLAAADWKSSLAKVVQMVTDSFGYLHINLVLTEPAFDLVKSVRKRINFQIEMIRPSLAKIYKNKPDLWGKRDYRERMVIMNLGMPQRSWWLEYTKRKRTTEFSVIMKEARARIEGKRIASIPKVSKNNLIIEYLRKSPDKAKLPVRQLSEVVKQNYNWDSCSLATISNAVRSFKFTQENPTE